jgi:hypothetical protein
MGRTQGSYNTAAASQINKFVYNGYIQNYTLCSCLVEGYTFKRSPKPGCYNNDTNSFAPINSTNGQIQCQKPLFPIPYPYPYNEPNIR